ncbi:MAG TPA: hypothetical protein VGM51_11755 [Armatimonadota bacterium]
MAELISERCVLDGVPKVEFYSGGPRCPEDVPFPSCLRACLEFLGDPVGCKLIDAHASTWRLDCGYAFLMASSGCAFRLSWKPGWEQDNVDIRYISDDPEAPFRHAFESVGYAYTILRKDIGESAMRDAIVNSLRRSRRPVIAFGVIPPPESCIVTGYDEGGEVLIGWNYFQSLAPFNAGVEFEPTGEFRKRDWFADTEGIILIGEKGPVPDARKAFLESLRWALQVCRTPFVEAWGRHNGFAAYSAWAAHLLRDEDFATDDLDRLRILFEVHDDAVGTVAEGRWYASEYLKMVAQKEPAMASELLDAAECYVAEHDLMWEAWGQVGGNGRDDDKVRKLKQPHVRRAVASIVERARQQDIEAANHLQKALAIATG